MLQYQVQDSDQTLLEGITEYITEFSKQFGDRKMTPEASEFFRCHDVAHVIFGCDISLDDELAIKISSIFGTTAGMSVLNGYRLVESEEVYRALNFRDILSTALKSVLIVPKSIWRCARMHKRWTWDNHEEHLSTPLGQLRRSFGIRVMHT